MGQKIHPHGLRLGITSDWKSHWYADKNYADYVAEDIKVREYLEKNLERAGISGDQVDYVIMGQVLQAGAGQITARQAAVNAGIGMDVPATTINKVCLSGLNAIAMADQLIRAGDREHLLSYARKCIDGVHHIHTGLGGDVRMIALLQGDALGGGFEVGFGGVGGDGDFAAQFAVDLNHDFDFGFDQGGFVDCRPACFPQFRAV